jgi:Cys-rich four helix bundle protein (predicted Tat secretion target)
MNRRDLMTNSAALTLAAVATNAMAQEAAHVHHHSTGGPYKALIDATSDCNVKGQLCVNHCLDLLAQGEKEMAACAKSVNQMMALCSAVTSLAIQQSPYLRAVIKTAVDAFQACEKECRKHEKKHAECKDCADACANCVKQCKALPA